MGRKLSTAENELYQRMDEVLHYVWDPIGVAEATMARDEYYSYLPHVFGLLNEKKGKDAVAKYLSAVRTDRMGLPENSKRDEEVAELLLEWKSTIDEKYI
jgi:hypothetical protein